MISNLITDLRYAVRGFLRRPLFPTVVVFTLAFGIGVNVAIFSLFEQVLLRPLPVQEPERLVNLVAPGPRAGWNACNEAGSCDQTFSYPTFRDLERMQEPFLGIAGHRLVEANLSMGGRSLSAQGMLVSRSYFSLLGLQPALGRLLGPQDDSIEGDAESVVLSYAYWQNHLGADPDVVGRRLVVNGEPLTIVGVAPQEFHGTTAGRRPEVYVPVTFKWLDRPNSIPDHANRRNYWLYLFARLKPGVSIDEAQIALDTVYRAIVNDVEAPLQIGLSEQMLEQFRAKTLMLDPGAGGQTNLREYTRTPLTLLLAVAALVLLLTCANVANLMLARGAARGGEMALRSSMGAGPTRLATLLATESLLLAIAAAIVSLPLALAMIQSLLAVLPQNAVVAFQVDVDMRSAAFAIVLAVAAAMMFALAPVLKLARTEPGQVLQAEGARSTGGRATARFRLALATTQIALSMTLLVLAGLFAQSLANAVKAELGIQVESLLTFRVAPELNGYSAERAAQLFDDLEQDLAALPGVDAVATSAVPLLGNSRRGLTVAVEGFDANENGSDSQTSENSVGSGFFDTLGMPLLSGRSFTAADSAERPRVAVVNERFAEHFGLGREAVGKRLSLGRQGPLDIEIIGVARDAKYSEVKDDVEPQLFLPRRQSPQGLGVMSFYVRSALPPEQLLTAIPRVVATHDPELPVVELRTMEQQVRENLVLDRFVTMLAGGFALLATVLAAVGLYGLLAYTLAQRIREMGLRLALGASPQSLRRLVLRQVGNMTLTGGAIGLVAAVLLGRASRALLFGVEAGDARVLVAAAALLAGVVLVAGYIPARRAARTDPAIALRHE